MRTWRSDYKLRLPIHGYTDVSAPSGDDPDRRPIGRIAMVHGPCGFGPRLSEAMRAAGIDFVAYGWWRLRYENRMRLDDPADCVQQFREEGITHVLHVGTFGAARFISSELMLAEHSDETMTGFLWNMATLRRSNFAQYVEELEKAGLKLLMPGDLFEIFKPHKGAMGKRHLAPAEARLLERLKFKAMGILAKRSELIGIAQAVVFDGDELRAIESEGTDTMLDKLPRAKNASPRVLVKLLPPYATGRVDPPTIGSITIEHAVEAKVDIVAIDASHGVLVDRVQTASTCDAAGIALVGI